MAAFLARLEVAAASDHSQMLALLEHVASNGPPHNQEKSRRLGDQILELKTRGGIRVLYFYDASRIVIGTEGLRKPKPSALRSVIHRAEQTRVHYIEAQRRGEIEIEDEHAGTVESNEERS